MQAGLLSGFGAETVISLGVDCRVRFQISRLLRGGVDLTEPAMRPEAHLFDWNVTEFADLLRAVAVDFDGMFRPEQLVPLDYDPNAAVDGLTGFRHFHVFDRAGGSIGFDEMIARQYPGAAQKIFYLRDKFLAHLRGVGRTVYVRCQASSGEAEYFARMMAAKYPAHPFHLVVVQPGEATTGLVRHGPNVSVYGMCRTVNKPAEAQWTGDDREWDRLFEVLFGQAGCQPGGISLAVR